MKKTRIALLAVLLSSIQLIQAQITISTQPAALVTNLVTGLWAPLGGIPNSGENVLIPVVASGGAGSPQDMLEVLTKGRADAALAASIFHFGTYSIGQVKQFLAQHGVSIRLV